MDVAVSLNGRSDGVYLQFAVDARERNQFRAPGEKFGRAAFIGVAMRELMTDDRVIRTAKLRQRECICRCSVENQEDLAIRFKNFPDARLEPTRPLVPAVGNISLTVCLL